MIIQRYCMLVASFTSAFIVSTVWFIGFGAYNAKLHYYHSSDTQVPVTAISQSRSKTIFVIDFENLAKTFNDNMNDSSSRLIDYYFVTPSRQLLTEAEHNMFSNVGMDNMGIAELVKELELNANFEAIAGHTVLFPDPVCNITKAHRTIVLSTLSQVYRSMSGSAHDTCLCYTCDLLSDTFIVRGSFVRKFFQNYPRIHAEIGAGIHLLFFLNLEGRAGYCPCINMTLHGVASLHDYTCNNLGTRWDQKFASFPAITGYLRIVNPNKKEAWLQCVWSQTSTDRKLPNTCANFLFRYLTDIVVLLENYFSVDYRIAFGTLIGALRNHDIIPWTGDVDVAVNVSNDFLNNFNFTWFSQLGNASQWLYDPLSVFGSIHGDGTTLRAFPRCPTVVQNAQAATLTNNEVFALVEREVDAKLAKNDHMVDFQRIVGYVDIYLPESVNDGYHRRDHKIFDQPDLVYIRNRTFKGCHNAKKAVELCYGKGVVETIPQSAQYNFSGVLNVRRRCLENLLGQ